MPRRIDDHQLPLFPPDLRDLAKSIGLDWWAAKKLYDDKWLSFDPEINTTDSSSREAEFIFLGTLVAAGCDPHMLKRLLETLEKPYCYHLSGMYYDWAKRCWEDFPETEILDIVSEYEGSGDLDSLEELKGFVQGAMDRLNGEEKEPCDQYDYNAEDDTIVNAARRLLWKISASALVDTPSKRIVIGKLFSVFQNLPKITLHQYLIMHLVGPPRYGTYEILHEWTIVLRDTGYLNIASGGYLKPYEDSFTSMTWGNSPTCVPKLNNNPNNIDIIDDADTFENEVEAMDLESGGYKLTVTDPTLEGLEEEDNNQDEDSDTEETDEGSHLPETCLSIWLIADEDTQLIYRASARAYAISGTDEDKGRILKYLSRSDYHLAKHFSLTDFKSNIIDRQGGKRQVDGIFINSLDTNLPRIIEIICKGLESEFSSQPILTASGCKMYKMEIPKEPLYVLTFLLENGAGELKVRKNTLGALDAIARAFTGNHFVPLVAQEIMLDETADHYAGTKIRTDQLKKGMRVRMRNGLEAVVVKECDGNTLIAKVFGAFTETGSVYAHNIVATEVDGKWIEVEMTEEQARFYREVKPFFDGNINIDTIKCK
jgi:hypothetical protein